jgi:methionyl-tRNA formyltransferase
MTAARIVFMGTPEFAVATLDALVSEGFDVAAVVTAPDRPAGRGRQLKGSAVKERALALGLPVLQPERLKAPEFLAALDALNASLYIVVAFRMLPEVVWARPALGTINLHGSLLPDYRGAAPINWAVINGEQRTGVTTFRIQQEIDTGDILLQEAIAIGPDETAGELHDRMMQVGAALMVRTVHGLANGTLTPVPQTVSGTVHAAPKLGPDTARLEFACPAAKVHDLVRGMGPYPGAWCMFQDGDRAPIHFKILRTRHTSHNGAGTPGTISAEHDRMLFAVGDGWLEAVEVQPEGKRRMAAGEFLRGVRNAHDLRFA